MVAVGSTVDLGAQLPTAQDRICVLVRSSWQTSRLKSGTNVWGGVSELTSLDSVRETMATHTVDVSSGD